MQPQKVVILLTGRYAGKKVSASAACPLPLLLMLEALSDGSLCRLAVSCGHTFTLQAVIVKNYDDGDKNSDRSYGHALVVGLAKEPRKVQLEADQPICRWQPVVHAVSRLPAVHAQSLKMSMHPAGDQEVVEEDAGPAVQPEGGWRLWFVGRRCSLNLERVAAAGSQHAAPCAWRVDKHMCQVRFQICLSGVATADLHQGGQLPAHHADAVHTGPGPEGSGAGGRAGPGGQEGGGAQGGPAPLQQ